MAFEKHIRNGNATTNLDMGTYTLLFDDGANIARSATGEITITGTLVVSAGITGFSGDSDAATLTNKTINGSNNTITNIGSSEIEADIITGQTEKVSPAANDMVLIWDNAGAALKKADVTNLPGGGALSNAYSNITDGTTTANASSADTFKLRSSDGSIDISVTNDDGTHGDNADITLAAGGTALSAIADQAAWTILARNAGTSGAVSAAALADITEEGSPTTGDFVLGFIDTGEIRKYDIANLPTTGQNNTASNVGLGGVGLYKTKSGVDLQFKNINAGSSKITVTDDPGNSEVDVDLAPGNVLTSELNNDAGWTANPNAIETNVAGELNGLTAKSTPTTSDILLIEDAADSYNKKKITISSLPEPTLSNDTVTNAMLDNMAEDTIKGRISTGTGDPEDLTAAQVRTIINVEDGSTANTNAVETDIADQWSALTEKVSLASDDLLLLEDSAAAGAKKKVKISSITVSGSITVEESDGSPSVTATALEFNQADGFSVVDEGGGRARVDLNPTISVTESDGTPIVAATTIEFNQADGFTVTDEGGGTARVDFAGFDCGTL